MSNKENDKYIDRLIDQRAENDRLIDKCIKTLGKISAQIEAMNAELYRDNLSNYSLTRLKEEFCTRVGDETREFDAMLYNRGRSFIEEYLLDAYRAGGAI